MSVETLALVLHHSKAKGTAKLVLLGIANHAGDGGAWPSVTTLARYANVHERNVQRAIEQLVSAGELGVHVQAGGLGNLKDFERPNRYDVLIACPATCDRTASHRHIAQPNAQAALWIDRVADSPPGGAIATGGVADSPPGGVALSPPEPYIEPNSNHLVDVSAAPRADCDVCSQSYATCMARAAVSGHAYSPKPQRREATG